MERADLTPSTLLTRVGFVTRAAPAASPHPLPPSHARRENAPKARAGERTFPSAHGGLRRRHARFRQAFRLPRAGTRLVNPPMIRVLIVDDSATARLLLTKLLTSDPEIEVVGTANDGAEGVARTLELRPNLITMDIRMPRMDGLEATRQIMEKIPTPIIVVSASVELGRHAHHLQRHTGRRTGGVGKAGGVWRAEFRRPAPAADFDREGDGRGDGGAAAAAPTHRRPADQPAARYAPPAPPRRRPRRWSALARPNAILCGRCRSRWR